MEEQCISIHQNYLNRSNLYMECEKCKESDFNKLKVIQSKTKLNINIYTKEEWESTLFTTKCLSCGHKF